MTPQELKNSILQLAIQGRLVEQRPEEGTAEELYREIQREKAALVKAGKIKKEKPLPEIKADEVPFEIPETWKWVRFASVIDVRDGTHDTPKYVPNGIPLVTSKNLVDGKIDFETAKHISSEDANKINIRSRVDEGDILFAMIGTIGNPVLVKKDREFSIKNMALFKQIAFSQLDMRYVLFFLQTAQSDMKKISNASVQSFVSLTVLRNYLFPLPPLAEQKRIVAKIEELLPYIDRYEKSWSRLEDFNKRFPTDMQKSILQLAIQGKLVEQRPEESTGEELYRQIQAEKQSLIRSGKLKKEKPLPEITPAEIPFDIPESWKWVQFLSVVDIATNLVQPADYQDYMHIAPDNIEKGNGHLLECKTVKQDKVASANHLFHKGQVLYSKIRPLLRKAVIAPFDGLCSADMYPLDTRLDVQYLLHFILSDAFNLQIATAMSSRVKMPKINQNELSKVLIPLPPLAEQKRIVAKLEELLPLCERLK